MRPGQFRPPKPITIRTGKGRPDVVYIYPTLGALALGDGGERGLPDKMVGAQIHGLIAKGLRALDARELKALSAWIREAEKTDKWNEKIPRKTVEKIFSAAGKEEGNGQYGERTLMETKELFERSDAETLGQVISSCVDFAG